MRKVFYLPLFVILLISLFRTTASAQTASVDTIGDLKSEKKASFKIGVNYLSNSVYFGRADTVKTPVIEPSLKYTFKSGIYFSGNMQFIPNRATNKLDGGSLGAGYDYDINDNCSGSISFTKLFYNVTSTQIGSSIGSTINGEIDYDIADIITPSLSVDYDFLKQGFGSDVLVNFGIAHDFAKLGIFGDDDLGIISPTATVNAGTQNFYDAYLTLKKYKLTKKGKAREAAAEKLLTAQDAKLARFNLLDYEFSAPVEYKTGKFIFSFTPTYALAENKLPPRINKGLEDINGGMFYFEMGASVKF
jgi:hypothetical protein